ncbi:MAG: hypothetical protein J6Z79_03365 [Clostridia bacterium]|nr:hypothetical protein [Clostridia bacterium]
MKVFCDLGEGTGLPAGKIVLILDPETATRSRVTRDFLKKCSAAGAAQSPRSPLKQVNALVLANSHGKDALYSSPRSPEFLARQI